MRVVEKKYPKKIKLTLIIVAGLINFFFASEIICAQTEPPEVSVREDTQEANFYFEKGTDDLKQGRFQNAIDEFKTAISLDVYHSGSHFNLGCSYALTGEYQQAISEFETTLLLESKPMSAFCYFNIAGIYTKRGLLEKDPELLKKATANFKKATEVLPNFILAVDYARHSHANIELINTVASVMYILKEISVPVDSAIFLPETKFKGEAEERICIFDAESPALLYFYHSPNCYWRICEAKLDLEHPINTPEGINNCLESLLHLLEDQPNTHLNKLIKWRVCNLFSYFYAKKEDWDKAIELAEKARSVGLNYSEEYANLAIFYFRKGDYQEASEAAKRALEIFPKSESRYFLEDIIKTGDIE